MDALTILDKILKSNYPILGLVFYLTFEIVRAIKRNWKGFTTFCKDTVNRFLTDKEQQIEVDVELEFQIKALVSTQNATQEQLNVLIEQNHAFKAFLGDLTQKLEFLSEGFWENRRTIEGYFKKTDALWSQIGVLPQEKTS